jgi:tetratricopeptide (TPR) repeat protein
MAAAVVAADWAERRPLGAAAPRWAAIALAFLAYWGARAALGIHHFDLPPLALVPGLLARYFDAVRIYAVRAWLPLPLTVGHPYAPNVLGVAIGAVVFSGLIALAAWRRRLAVPVTIFLVGLVPIGLAIARLGDSSERYFYLPAIGLALLLGEILAACAAAPWRALRVASPTAVCLVTLLGLFRLEARVPDWRADDTLFAAALRVNPEDAQANQYVGIAAIRRRDWDEACRALGVARKADPGSGRIAGAYAWALLQSGDAAAATRAAEDGVALEPFQVDTWWTLTLARHRAGDHRGELAAVEKLLELSPRHPGGREARARAECEVSGRTDCEDPRARAAQQQ